MIKLTPAPTEPPIDEPAARSITRARAVIEIGDVDNPHWTELDPAFVAAHPVEFGLPTME